MSSDPTIVTCCGGRYPMFLHCYCLVCGRNHDPLTPLRTRIASLEAQAASRDADAKRMQERVRELEGALSDLCSHEALDAEARRLDAIEEKVSTLTVERDFAQERVRELEAERTATVAMLRQICTSHGDNDWRDTLHLADVIEKHLWPTLEAYYAPAPPPAPAAPVAQDAVHGERSTSAWARTLLDVPDAHEPGCPKRIFSVLRGDAVRIEDRVCRCIVGRVAGVGVEECG